MYTLQGLEVNLSQEKILKKWCVFRWTPALNELLRICLLSRNVFSEGVYLGSCQEPISWASTGVTLETVMSQKNKNPRQIVFVAHSLDFW